MPGTSHRPRPCSLHTPPLYPRTPYEKSANNSLRRRPSHCHRQDLQGRHCRQAGRYLGPVGGLQREYRVRVRVQVQVQVCIVVVGSWCWSEQRCLGCCNSPAGMVMAACESKHFKTYDASDGIMACTPNCLLVFVFVLTGSSPRPSRTSLPRLRSLTPTLSVVSTCARVRGDGRLVPNAGHWGCSSRLQAKPMTLSLPSLSRVYIGMTCSVTLTQSSCVLLLTDAAVE